MYPAGTHEALVIIERGSSQAYAHAVFTVTLNNIPSGANYSVTQPDYCSSGPGAFVSWDYVDADNLPEGTDPQSAFQVQIDRDSTFTLPIDHDSGKVTGSSGNYFAGTGIEFNDTYYVRVKVWDSHGASSSWSPNFSFTTPAHHYPGTDFTPPTNPKIGKLALFIDTTDFDPVGTDHSWSWLFCASEEECTPTASTLQNPSTKFFVKKTYQVTLTASDDVGICPKTKSVNVGGSFIPRWREIAPW